MLIPPKAGRLATGAYEKYSPITGKVFRPNNQAQVSTLPTGPGGISTKPSTAILASPLVNHFNTGTIRKVPAAVSFNNMFLFSPANKPRVQPQMRSILPNKKETPIVKRVAGPSPTSNTPFHPKPEQMRKAPRFRSEISTERLSIPSFSSVNNLWGDPNNSFYLNQQQIGSDRVGRGRWGTIKQGAV